MKIEIEDLKLKTALKVGANIGIGINTILGMILVLVVIPDVFARVVPGCAIAAIGIMSLLGMAVS
jgi:hypothetical protein